MTTFLIDAAALCVLFHLVIWLPTRKDPAKIIHSYPPAILERSIELGKTPNKKRSGHPEKS